MKKDEQENLFATMESEEATPSLSQAQRMKTLSQSGRLDMDTIFAIMTVEKGNQKETVKIGMERLKKYFPKGTTPKQMEDTIIKLLERELQRKRGNVRICLRLWHIKVLPCLCQEDTEGEVKREQTQEQGTEKDGMY